MTAIKRKALSLQEKITILKLYDERLQTKNQSQIAVELKLPVSTLRTLVKRREDIEEKYRLGDVNRKRQKIAKFDNLEKIVLDWFYQARALGKPISGPMLCEKARQVADSLQISEFTGSNGWISRFKNRHSVVYRQINGETATEAQLKANTWTATLPELLQIYEPQNIFNADEFSLFYRLMPNESCDFKKTCHGGESSKERLTVLICTNSDGSEKLPLLVIGKAKDPGSFKNIRSLPVVYDAQSRAWMTALRFIEWLKCLDDHFQTTSRRIILIIDNCPVHPKDVELKNIRLVFLPQNETSKLQPMEQGIIKILKQSYRIRLIHRHLRETEDPESKRPVTVHDAILNIAAAWESVKPETIKNCFKKVGFSFNENDIALEEEKEPEILQNFLEYCTVDDNVPPYGIRSIEDLIEDLVDTQKGNVSDDDEDEEESAPILSNSQALSVVNDLKRYLASLSESEEALQKLNDIENLIFANASKFVPEPAKRIQET